MAIELPRVLKNMNSLSTAGATPDASTRFNCPNSPSRPRSTRAGGMDLPVEIDPRYGKPAELTIADHDPEVGSSSLFGSPRQRRDANHSSGVPSRRRARKETRHWSIPRGGWKEPMLAPSPVTKQLWRLGGGELLGVSTIDDEGADRDRRHQPVRKVGGVDQMAEIRAAIGL